MSPDITRMMSLSLCILLTAGSKTSSRYDSKTQPNVRVSIIGLYIEICMHYYSNMIIYLSMLSGAMPMCLLMDFMPICLRMDFPISRHRLYGCMDGV